MATREEHAVSLKLPTFWTSQPEVWFTQAEAQFNLRRITSDETKYFYVVAALDQDTATRLIDLIQRPPDTDKYNKLKERLVDTFGLSRRERASRLLHFRPLGDSKPSSLMDEMLALGGDHVACPLFEQLFLERLPDDIRIQLVDTKFEDCRQLAKRADALWESRDMGPPVANALHRRRPRRHPKLPPNQEHKQDDDTPNQLCYYHRTFGEAARQCRQPCSWTGNSKASH